MENTTVKAGDTVRYERQVYTEQPGGGHIDVWTEFTATFVTGVRSGAAKNGGEYVEVAPEIAGLVRDGERIAWIAQASLMGWEESGPRRTALVATVSGRGKEYQDRAGRACIRLYFKGAGSVRPLA